MITRLSVRNVRLFAERDWHFPLSPLTVFCGTNSAGKSTLLKMILLLRQSQGIQEGYQETRAVLRSVGTQVDLGDYATLVSWNDAKRDVLLGIDVQDTASESTLAFLRSLDLYGKPESPKQGQSPSTGATYTVSSQFCFGPVQLRVSGSGGQRDTHRTITLPAQLKNGTFSVIADDHTLLSWRVELDSSENEDDDKPEYKVILPRKYFAKVGGFKLMQPSELGRDRLAITALMWGILPSSLIAKHPKKKGGARRAKGRPPENEAPDSEEEKERWGAFPLPPHIEDAQDCVARALRNVQYIAPLRSAAKRFYVSQLGSGSVLDAAGEYLPHILKDQHQTRKPVLNCRPDSGSRLREEPLVDALNGWLRHLRSGEATSAEGGTAELRVATTRQVLVEIGLRSIVGEGTYALADSGFGYSQVLPILVAGLLTEPGGTLLVEQPELHLNPALQVRLADFLVAMVRTGRQLVIETHSEHIVNAIRVLIAEDEAAELKAKCLLYFIDAGEQGAVVHDLGVKEDGTIPEWPPDFFGEAVSLSGRLMRAQARFRNRSTRGTE